MAARIRRGMPVPSAAEELGPLAPKADPVDTRVLAVTGSVAEVQVAV